MTLYDHAIIFAGGKSSRMGEDKALLPFGKYKTLTDYQYEKLKKIFHTVSISAKENKFDSNYPVIIDIYKESSPLVGLLSIFQTLKEVNEVFILSVDAPFVDERVIKHIMEKKFKASDAIIAKSPNGLQPLCGLYKRSISVHAYKQYEKNNHKLQDLLAIAETETVIFEENQPFTNLNYPKEYEEALKFTL